MTSETATTDTHPIPPEAQKRVKQIVVEGLRLQASRDPVAAAQAAHEPGGLLSFYVLVQCSWRGIDPAPFLEQIGVDTIGDRPITCRAHLARHSDKKLVHHELTNCVKPVPADDGAMLSWDASRLEDEAFAARQARA